MSFANSNIFLRRSWRNSLVESEAARPNTRVQRTRSSASRRHSPLTRSPLGDVGRK